MHTGGGGRQGKGAHGKWWEAGNSSPEFSKKKQHPLEHPER